MKKVLIAAVLLAVAGVGIAYLFKSNISGRALLQRFEEGAESNKSNEQLLAELKVHIDDLSRGISEHQLKLLRTARMVESVEADIRKCCDARDAHQAQLVDARRILTAGSAGDITIASTGSRKYTRAEIEADVKNRLTHVQHLKTLIETKEQTLALLRATHDNGKRAIAEAIVVKNQKMHELEALSVRLKNAEHLKEIRAISGELNTGIAAMQSSGFRRSWEELMTRIDAGELDLRNTKTPSGLLDYRAPVDGTTELLRAIDAALETAKSGGTK
jgi:hypothetical protein